MIAAKVSLSSTLTRRLLLDERKDNVGNYIYVDVADHKH